MLRSFRVLATLDGLLLLTSLVVGLLARGGERTELFPARSPSFQVELVAAISTLLLHATAYSYLRSVHHWAARTVKEYRLPEWIQDQTAKNVLKARRFVCVGVVILALSMVLGVIADAAGLNAAWHFGPFVMAFGFNLGAFGVEYAVLAIQVRLRIELKSEAERLRLIRDDSALTAERCI